MRKFGIIILVIMLTCTFFIFSAAATTELEARVVLHECPNCGLQNATLRERQYETLLSYESSECPFGYLSDTHRVCRVYDEYRCPDCGIIKDYDFYNHLVYFCIYRGSEFGHIELK